MPAADAEPAEELQEFSYQFSRAIPGLALRASELADASGLLMIRRSLSPSPVRQIHASMICRTNSGWLN